MLYIAGMNTQQLADYCFSKAGAARYLDHSIRWLDYQLSGPNPPPGFKVGKTWIFKKSDLDRWLEQFRASADLVRIADEALSAYRSK